MALTEEERCATCGSGDPRVTDVAGDECGDPYHACTWDDDQPISGQMTEPRPSDLRVTEPHERDRSNGMSQTDHASTFAAILGALLVGHNVGDHITQTDHQAAHKAANWSAMAGHVGGYTATCAVALGAVAASTGLRTEWRRTLVGLAFSAATHAVIDRRWPVREVLERTGSPKFAQLQTPINGPYLADQALHHACLLVAALIMAPGRRVARRKSR